MKFEIQMEESSPITRKFKIKVPASLVANRFEKGLIEVQRTARIKGFRPGHVPLSIVKQYYGEDVRHRVYHNLIDESFHEAVREHKVRAIGSPKIEEAKEHKTGGGDHDHAIQEDKDLNFTATVEILPEIEVKGYTGVSLSKENNEITDKEVSQVIENLRNSQAELTPVGGGLAMADGSTSSRPAVKGDFVEMTFSGGLVTDSGIEEKPGMKGDRLLEIGSNSLIPGFEDNLVGMRKGETKTFRVPFPKDYHEKDFAGKESEFTVTVNEVKEKKLPALDESFAKQMGYDNLDELNKKVREHLVQDKTEEVERKLRSDLLQALIDKNKFDVPQALVESQTRALAQDWAQELKRQGFNDQMIQQAITSELENLKKRADNQVRSSLILEAIAKKENIEIKPEDFEAEVAKAAGSMKVEPEKLHEFYAKDPGRKEDFMFRMRQERTVSFLLEKAKIKSKS